MRQAWVAGLVLAAACGGGESGGPEAATTRDSAGITIVENSGTGWPAGQGWTLSAEPVVQLGGAADDPALDFGRVTGALLLADGGIAVANGATSEVRLFGADGTHRSSSGRSGSGPGEYTAIAGMWKGAGDSLLVLDIMVRRLTVLGPDGGVGRSFALGGMGGSMVPSSDGTVSFAIPAGVLADGSMLGLSQSFQINAAREGAFRDSVPAVRYGPDGAVRDTLGWFPGIEMEQLTLNFAGQSFSTPTPVPLGRNTVVLAAGDRFYVATNDAWEVEVWNPAGGLAGIYRVAMAPRPLNSAGIATHREEQIALMDAQMGGANVPPQLREQMVNRINSASYPPSLPYIAAILRDDAGNLWVQEQDQPGDQTPRFAVLDPAGALLGYVDMPARFRPTHITTDRVVGIWQDDDDVEYVRVYGLDRG